MALTIPADLVQPLRDGLCFDLAMQAEGMDALVEPHDRGDVRAALDLCLARVDGTRALLDVMGWAEPEGGPHAIDVEPCEHGEALLRALHLRIEAERGFEGDRLASAEERAEARARAARLVDLAQRVEEAGAGWATTATVPARLVNLLREALVVKLAEAAGEIADSGRSHPDAGIDADELESFDTCRALLEQVGTVRAIPAAQLDLDLRRREHRQALAEALAGQLESEQYLMDVDRTHPSGARQHRKAQRRAKQIEALMASAGLDGDDGAEPRGAGA
jgi:hypothetical protein